ncbi:type II secretion system protein GspC [Methylonatrum kenyense]|uniref:type II secretion system protein GspC n=1 Tax=Methylonatrum kenyense TaxID=455253 RepID=UPI0020BFF184|nr:type II secretion system protein GspC [Methylonatrum kenyense]MCK8517035.1 type II secretion system protein GspC [Methylonatrum kenyense]
MNAVIDILGGPAARSRALRLAAVLLAVVLVVLLADTAARLVWQVLSDRPVVSGAPQQDSHPDPRAQPRGENPGTAVAELHLFGRAEPRERIAEIPDDAPQTRLNLSLRGLFHSASQDKALAIIAAGNDGEDIYRVGDEVPGGASIDAIRVDRVVLLRNGRHEILNLPEERVDTAEAAPSLPDIDDESAADNGSTENGGSLAEARRQMLRDPSSMAHYIQMQPETDGDTFLGFRLTPGEDASLMERVGLQEGDVVTSLGGTVLDSAEAGVRALRGVARADQVEVQVLRDGVEQTVMINFNDEE